MRNIDRDKTSWAQRWNGRRLKKPYSYRATGGDRYQAQGEGGGWHGEEEKVEEG